MRALGVKVQDRVRVSFVRLQLPTKVVLQPLNQTWDTIFMNSSSGSSRSGSFGSGGSRRDPAHILEHQLNKFSTLTAGAVISLEIEGIEYSFLIKDIQGETGVSVYGARVQDSDISVEIDRNALMMPA
jgi:hypothetical protein